MAKCGKCGSNLNTLTLKCPRHAEHERERGKHYQADKDKHPSYVITDNRVKNAASAAKDRAKGATVGRAKSGMTKAVMKRTKCSVTGKKISDCSCKACKALKG